MKILLANPFRVYTDREWTWQTDYFEIKSLLEQGGNEVRFAYTPQMVKPYHYDVAIMINDVYDFIGDPIKNYFGQELLTNHWERSFEMIHRLQDANVPVGIMIIDPNIEYYKKGYLTYLYQRHLPYNHDIELTWDPDFITGKVASKKWVNERMPEYKNILRYQSNEAWQEYKLHKGQLDKSDYDWDFTYGGSYRHERAWLFRKLVEPIINRPDIKTMTYGEVNEHPMFYEADNNETIGFIEPSKIIDTVNKSKLDLVISEDKFGVGPRYVTPRIVTSLMSNSMSLFYKTVDIKRFGLSRTHNVAGEKSVLKFLNSDNSKLIAKQQAVVINHDFAKDEKEMNEFLEKVIENKGEK